MRNIKTKIYKALYFLTALLVLLLVAMLLLSFGEKSRPPYELGATFRYIYTRDILKLDWQKTYISMLDDIKVRNLRLPVYWDDLEKSKGSYDFSNLDFEMNQAEQRGAKVILTLGRRGPGWPECHIPDWAAKEDLDSQQKDLLEEISQTVNKYKESQALQYWQIENEPFLLNFGLCPKYPVGQYLDQEIALVRSLDPNHPIITTDSGELSIWLVAASRGDIFGSTLYRSVYVDHLEHYVNYFLPPVFFRAKKGLVHLFHPNKEIINIELQAEPWTHVGVVNTPFAEQFITFAPGSVQKNIDFARASGFSKSYLWGVEYWYWAAQNGHPEFLQEGQAAFKEEQ